VDWFDALPDDVKKGVSESTVTPEREAKLIESWKKNKG
jgi:hypothetical protein